ncbi:hypothetical protein PC9H_002961 [Pleurotus ostreatus]|uniref:L-tyrosine decarboxylase C-terminal domain-containing protein n=1 Tax=Pleurotus ostreatus TaxID=5322 RepID=A0A8H6ZXF8_PLEOS|nr:uncharacterized protein PC9H_002961 [Pleurotus ostreatus]KAF7436135.1 hypothetical protein PC9H_002961 [Pleurotus ostreatus]
MPLDRDYETASALFLGPTGESMDFFRRCLADILGSHQTIRLERHNPADPVHHPLALQSDGLLEVRGRISARLHELLMMLQEGSSPIVSPRYLAHVCCEPTLPSILGYFAVMLLNQNNCIRSLGPVTAELETIVGHQLCRMLGFTVDPDLKHGLAAWGHLVGGGTIANLEALLPCLSLFLVRNLKFYPFAVLGALRDDGPLASVGRAFRMRTRSGKYRLLREMAPWDLFNLGITDVLDIPTRLRNEFGVSKEVLDSEVDPHTCQSLGMFQLAKRWNMDRLPKLLIASSRHYSWPKSAAFAGIGSKNIINVDVDNDVKMSISHLRTILEECLESKQPIYAIVATIGTSQEGAVDPVHDIIELRKEFAAKGLSFAIHADAAWGGYFATMMSQEFAANAGSTIRLRKETERNFASLKDVDSITVDPHKSGYVLYPAGGLCYRDGRTRYLVTWSAPYIEEGLSNHIGWFGVEGSKPGASAAAVWLSHEVIGLNVHGYGALHRRALLGGRLLYCHLATMSGDQVPFIVVPFNRLPSQRSDDPCETRIRTEQQFIRHRILGVSEAQLEADSDAVALLNSVGSELNLNPFVCNFRLADGSANTSVRLSNSLNERIAARLSVENLAGSPFIMSSTTFTQREYGNCLTTFKRRIGLTEGDENLVVLKYTVMSPFSSQPAFMDNIIGDLRKVLIEEAAFVINTSVSIASRL